MALLSIAGGVGVAGVAGFVAVGFGMRVSFGGSVTVEPGMRVSVAEIEPLLAEHAAVIAATRKAKHSNFFMDEFFLSCAGLYFPQRRG